MTAPRHRSLNLAQTLDELLGTGKSSGDSDRHSLNSPARPPTRHGRDSASAGSSNEENKVSPSIIPLQNFEEPSPKSPTSSASGIQAIRIHDGPPPGLDNDEDDFLSKLNALRRRSLVAAENATERKIPLVPEEKKRDLVRTERIREESEDEKEASRRPSTSSSHKTFQIGELSSATVLFNKKEPSVAAPPHPKPRSVGKPSTSTGMRALPTDDSNHSKWVRRKAEMEVERRRVENEKDEKKRRDEEEKRKLAKRTFERWKEDFEEKEKEKRREKTSKERVNSQSKDETERKKKEDAQRAFEAWKRERETRRKDETERRNRKEDEERRRKEEETKAKRQEAQKAFAAWKAKKERDETERKVVADLKKKEATERKKLNEEYKELAAQQAFETWMELKEVQYQQEQLLLDMPIVAARPSPWMPPSNTCPRQFTPDSRRRRKSLDRRPRITSAGTVRRSASAKSGRR